MSTNRNLDLASMLSLQADILIEEGLFDEAASLWRKARQLQLQAAIARHHRANTPKARYGGDGHAAR